MSADDHEFLVFLPTGNGGFSFSECATKIFKRLAAVARWVWRGAPAKIVSNENGVDVIELVPPEAFRSEIEKLGPVFARRWRKTAEGRKESLSRDNCSQDQARALLATAEASNELPHVVTLSQCPLLVPDGAAGCAVLGRGIHDFGGGTVILGGKADDVSFEDAVKNLKFLLEEFEYLTPADKARQIAAIISLALKFGGWISNNLAPIPINEADQSQAGKGLVQNMLAAIYNDTCVSVAARKGGVGSLDDSLSTALLSARPIIQLDNLRGKLDSPFVESYVTGKLVSVRSPYRADVNVDPRGTYLMATSNGVEMTPDLANRSVVIRTLKKVGYSFRKYDEGGLIEHVTANQGKYLGSIHAIIREWNARGRQMSRSTEHDFRPWVQTLDWILEHLFKMPGMMDGHEEAKARAVCPTRCFLRELLNRLRAEGRLDEQFPTGGMIEAAIQFGIQPPGWKEGADEDSLARSLGSKLWPLFRDSDTITLEGFTITKTAGTKARVDGKGGRDITLYTFAEDGGS